jgi:amino acid transporter
MHLRPNQAEHEEYNNGFQSRLKNAVIGNARDISDKTVFHKISLIAFFAWVGLGSDALSSSCYGPEEIMRNLQGHTHLAIFVGLLTALTIFIISTSYRQIIKLFPHGGGGYIVASKLLSPSTGMISGSALLIDYVLTITLSVSSGSDAIFSFLPPAWHSYKLMFAFMILTLLVIMNLRGVKESVMLLTPIFVVFVLTHIFLIGYSIFFHSSAAATIASQSIKEMTTTSSEIGIFATLMLMLRAYSMGAGTYTGIEAVSNGIPNLREPRAATAQKTMVLLSVSLAIAAFGLIISYYLYNVQFQPNKTLNAVLTENISSGWNPWIGKSFVYIVLLSEAALLFVAAQTGFLDGPRVMANMATDYWLPRRFMHLSDRLVSQNGILIMGGASFLFLYFSKGQVTWLVILYSINVFITFTLSQLGMVRHWIQVRKEEKRWFRKMMVNGIGLIMTSSILVTVVVLKFGEGGWITLVITSLLAGAAIYIKNHYNTIRKELILVQKEVMHIIPDIIKNLSEKHAAIIQPDKKKDTGKTIVIMVNGYNGLGLFSLFKILDYFLLDCQKVLFLQIGLLDSKSIRGNEQVEKLTESMVTDLQKYKAIAEQIGITADYCYSIGTDVVEEVDKMLPEIAKKYPGAIFIGGQLIFGGNTRLSRLLHNHTIFAIQRKLFRHGITTIVIPIPLEIDSFVSKQNLRSLMR